MLSARQAAASPEPCQLPAFASGPAANFEEVVIHYRIRRTLGKAGLFEGFE